MKDWRPFFPLKEPRADQARALDHMCAEALNGKKMFLAELGTGVGKSAVAVTFARWVNMYTKPALGFNPGATILTSQRILQDQYVRDFKTSCDLRSSANFKCTHPDGGPTCAATSRVRNIFKGMGSEQHAGLLGCSECPYRAAKNNFMTGPLGITNYSYFLSEAVYAEELPFKHILILDEAHNVEDEVRRWSSVNVSLSDASDVGLKLPFGKKTGDMIGWLSGEYKEKILSRMAEITEKLSKLVARGRLGEKTIGKLAEENEMLDKRLCQINRIVNEGGEIMVAEGSDGKSVNYSPLEVSGIANAVLYSRSDKVLLMTATVLDKKVFMRSAGLKEADTDFISIPTPFPAEHFGVHIRPIGKMSRAGIDDALPLLPKAIKKILAEHPNDKGIIHTTNYNIARKVGEVKDRRLLVQGSAADRNDIIERHFNSKEPTVIVSPSMIEGLDLKGDLGRFQVVCKVPYPDMSDPVVKRKMNSDKEWYAWRTIRSLAQALGRGVRSQDDYTSTYILDECYIDMLDRWGSMFPEHLISAMAVEEPF